MMQTILTAIAEGNLRMGMETMEHNSELKNAMKRVCRLEEELSATLNESEKELLEKQAALVYNIYLERLSDTSSDCPQ